MGWSIRRREDQLARRRSLSRVQRRALLGGCVVAALSTLGVVVIMSGPPQNSGHQDDSSTQDCFSAPPADTTTATAPTHDRGLGYPPERLDAVENYLAQHPTEAGRPVILAGGRVAVGFIDHGCQHLAALARVVPGGRDVIEVFWVPNSAAAVERAHDELTAALKANDPRLAGFEFVGWGPDDVGGHESVDIAEGKADVDDLRHVLTRDFAGGNATLYSVSVSHDPLPTAF